VDRAILRCDRLARSDQSIEKDDSVFSFALHLILPLPRLESHALSINSNMKRLGIAPQSAFQPFFVGVHLFLKPGRLSAGFMSCPCRGQPAGKRKLRM
jgi:hypothetical protein